MRSIPVKEAAFEGFTCVMLPEAKVVDLDTGEVRKDRRSGQTVYSVGVCAMRGRDSSVIQVAVVGEPGGLVLGAPVRVVDLEASPWERDGRSGVAWRAAAVVPAVPAEDGPSAPSRLSGSATRAARAASSASAGSSAPARSAPAGPGGASAGGSGRRLLGGDAG